LIGSILVAAALLGLLCKTLREIGGPGKGSAGDFAYATEEVDTEFTADDIITAYVDLNQRVIDCSNAVALAFMTFVLSLMLLSMSGGRAVTSPLRGGSGPSYMPSNNLLGHPDDYT
jgi:hypothetical protein